jgi:large repetitive protein
LNEGSGSIASDSSGNGFLGALINGPTWTSGVLGGGMALDGLDDYVVVAHTAALNPYPLSVVLWVRSGAAGLHGLVNKYLPGSLNGYQIFINSGMLCAWYFKDAGNYVWDGTGCSLMTPGVTDNLWHHVALVVDDSGGRLYVDGEVQASRAWTGTPGAVSTTTDLVIGSYPGVAAPYLPGTIDDVRLYDRALDADEVAGLHSGASR